MYIASRHETIAVVICMHDCKYMLETVSWLKLIYSVVVAMQAVQAETHMTPYV